MADELVFGAGFDAATLGAMPASRIIYWYGRLVERLERRKKK